MMVSEVIRKIRREAERISKSNKRRDWRKK